MGGVHLYLTGACAGRPPSNKPPSGQNWPERMLASRRITMVSTTLILDRPRLPSQSFDQRPMLGKLPAEFVAAGQGKVGEIEARRTVQPTKAKEPACVTVAPNRKPALTTACGSSPAADSVPTGRPHTAHLNRFDAGSGRRRRRNGRLHPARSGVGPRTRRRRAGSRLPSRTRDRR